MGRTLCQLKCIECGGKVTWIPRPDYAWTLVDGNECPYPDDVAVPSCDDCGEVYLDEALENEIEERCIARFSKQLSHRQLP